jgi:hypothetical protein
MASVRTTVRQLSTTGAALKVVATDLMVTDVVMPLILHRRCGIGGRCNPGIYRIRKPSAVAQSRLFSYTESKSQGPGNQNNLYGILTSTPGSWLAGSRRYFWNAASNATELGGKSFFFTSAAASAAPNSRSMPLSSHSTESGPV